jgi:hypothetical protein
VQWRARIERFDTDLGAAKTSHPSMSPV